MTNIPQLPLKPVLPRFSSARAIAAMMLREISTTYGRSPGGYLWAILEPAAGIVLLVLIFSTAFRAPPLGTSFALFYAAGMLPFLMFLDVSNKLSQVVQFSRQLLEYPRVTFFDALVARLVLNCVTQLMVHCLVLGFIFIVLDTHTSIDFGKMFTGYLMVISLIIGIGTINSFLTLAYPLWQNIWAILMRPLFIISGIFFLFESIPQPYSDILWYNPIVHILGIMRDAFYPFYNPDYVSITYVMIVSLVTALPGLFLLRRYHQDMLLK